MSRTVRIGSASGFWGDTAAAAPQLVRRGDVRYLVFDYLAEVTLSIMAAQRAKNHGAGWATDFVDVTMRELLREIRGRGIRVVANAGGMNPGACRDALARLAQEQGVALRIGVVHGDDLLPRVEALRPHVREMATGEPLPARLASANAYLGARPIAAALDAGCDVVITGRCVDSAVTLGILLHEFGWSPSDHDRLAQGTLAGHLVECGAQCTGGLYTDWQDVPGWDDIGFPVLECVEDGSFVVTKPPGTGGLVTPATVAEQLLYEIGDPRAYLVPDVSCDFTGVRFEAVGPHRVRVTGAMGRAPTSTYKVSATWVDGWRSVALLAVAGEAAGAKARRTGAAILARTSRMLAERGLPGYGDTLVECIGTGDLLAADVAGRGDDAVGDAVLRLSVRAPSRESLVLFGREFAAAATSMAPGTTGVAGGRPTPAPLVRLFSFLIDKREVPVWLEVDGERRPVEIAPGGGFDPTVLPSVPSWTLEADGTIDVDGTPSEPPGPLDGAFALVPLSRIAHGRSGDKGDIANIGVLARDPAWLPWLRTQLTPQRVARHLARTGVRRVERYDLPGCDALNFVLHGALGGGGMASLRADCLGKALAQALLRMPVRVPNAVPAAPATDGAGGGAGPGG